VKDIPRVQLSIFSIRAVGGNATNYREPYTVTRPIHARAGLISGEFDAASGALLTVCQIINTLPSHQRVSSPRLEALSRISRSLVADALSTSVED
jgi:hypothetical protein